MVLIKGMEMPENCRNCAMTVNENYEGLYCQITGKYCPNGERSNDCPLISVDSVIEQMGEKKAIYGAEFTRGTYEFNRGIDACIAILRGLDNA